MGKDIKVGFIGLGTMGSNICRNVLKAGYPVVVSDINQAAVDQFVKEGAQAAVNLKELAEMADLVITMLPSSKEVEAVVFSAQGLAAGMKKGSILIDMTTANPMKTKEISEKLGEKGIEMVDAPVSGGQVKAKDGTLTIMVGGREEIYKKCLPVLEAAGEKIFYIGPTSSGHAMKLVNNFLTGCNLAATTEAIMTAVKAGISPQVAVDVLQVSSGRTEAVENKFPNFVLPNRDYNFLFDLIYKDLSLYTELAEAMKVPAFISSVVQQIYRIPITKGEGRKDFLNIVNMYEEWCGVKIRGAQNNEH